MGFQWGNGEVFFSGIQMVSSSSKVKHHDFVEMKWSEQRKQPTNERTGTVAWGAKRFLIVQVPRAISWAYREQPPRLVQYWCPCDGWKEGLSHTTAFTDTWEEFSCICPKVHLPKTTTTVPKLLLVSQLSSLPVPHFWFYFCCLLLTSPFLPYPILWVIPLHFYSSVFPNLLPLLSWLFSSSHCRFSH